MQKEVLLVSVPFTAIEQPTPEEQEYWKWHYALKTKLTYPNLIEDQLLKLGNVENQNVGLLSIASYLTNNAVSVDYLAPTSNLIGNNRENIFLDKILKKIEKNNPQFIGFSAHTCSIPVAINYSKKLKEIYPNVNTVIGGAHANGSSGDILSELLDYFDYTIRGKGEIPFLNLLKGNVNSIGICYKKNGNEFINPVCPTSIADYPNPRNELLHVDELPAARVYTSLGCKNTDKCVFCADTLHNKDFVTKNIDNVIKEILFLYKNYNTRYFYFGDENFFYNKNRALKLMHEINKLDLDFKVTYQVRLDDADEELIKKAAEAGKCTEIQYGVESLSQEILDIIRKGLRLDNVKKVCEQTKIYGINTHGYFLVGLPGETDETAKLTLNRMYEYLDKRIIDVVEYRSAIPFPGTPMWEYSKYYGVDIKHKNWLSYRGEVHPPHNLINLTSNQIYAFYLQGLKNIATLYKKRYLEQFGDLLLDLKVLGTVTEGGF